MATDNYLLKEGKDKVIVGIGKTVSLIKGTYGAAGGNIISQESLYPFHRVSNDGKTNVEKVKLADPYENLGASIIREAGDKADKDSGDGRKTTMLLTEAIFVEASKEQAQPMELKRSLDACVPIIMESLDSQKNEITIDDVESVATISSENPMIGKMIGDIYKEIGKDGIIEVDNSNLPETFYEVTEGVRLRNAKFFGDYSSTEPGKAVFKNPKILISREKITSVDQLTPILQLLKANSINELVIYCEDIDMSVAARLALTHLQGGFKTLLIKAPTLWKDWIFEDFAKITGATAVDARNGKTFKNLAIADLGTCAKIVTTAEETRVIGIQDISAYVQELRDRNTDEGKIRAAWLQTKVAVLKVGANSDSELAYVAKKAKDACAASYLALQEGVVVGGGLALLNAREFLPDTVGGRVMKKVLEAPFSQIYFNATGHSFYESDVEQSVFSGNTGYNAKTGSIVDMWEEKILDPVLVVKNAVKNAVSIAGTVMTASGVTIIPIQEQNDSIRQMPGM